MSGELWVQLAVYALSMVVFFGAIWTKIGLIEKKIDQIQGLAKRILCAEQKTKTAHYRIDSISRSGIKDKKAHRR